MAKRKTTDSKLEGLNSLPLNPDLIFEGDLTPTGMFAQEGDGVAQVWVAIWVEVESGLVLATNIVSEQEVPELGVGVFLDTFADACVNRFGGYRESARPVLVRIPDETLAQAVTPSLSALGIGIESGVDAPALDAALESLLEHLGDFADDTPPEPFSWSLDPALLRPLYAAAASFARRKPWEWLDDNPPFEVKLGKDGPRSGATTVYGCVMGSAGMVNGIAFYDNRTGFRRTIEAVPETAVLSDEDFEAAVEQMRAAGAPVDAVPEEILRGMLGDMLAQEQIPAENMFLGDSMVVFFDPEEESDPSYVEWMRERTLPIASRQLIPRFFRARTSGTVSSLSEREARAMTMALEAMNGFLPQLNRRLQTEGVDELRLDIPVGPDKHLVQVRWPGD